MAKITLLFTLNNVRHSLGRVFYDLQLYSISTVDYLLSSLFVISYKSDLEMVLFERM